MQPLDAATQRFLDAGEAAAKPLPDDVRSTTLRVSAPGRWPDGPELNVRLHRRGQGPGVLLVHGWRSQAADLDTLSSMLVEVGFTVWMPDLPGHGHSEGRHLSIPLGAAVLQAAKREAGPFAAAVAHSYGGACLVHALAHGLSAGRVALLAVPTHYGHFARHSALQGGLPASAIDVWLDHLAQVIGTHPDEIAMAQQATAMTVPALLIHSQDDRVVPYEAAVGVAAAWPGAKFQGFDTLGHFRVLTDPSAIQAVRDWVAPAAGEPSADTGRQSAAL